MGGIFADEFIQFAARSSPLSGLIGILVTKFRGEEESISGKHLRNERGGALRLARGVCGEFEASGRHAIGEDAEHFFSELGIGCRSGEELFTGALIKGGGMHFVPGGFPTSAAGRSRQGIGHDLLPDQGLDTGRGDEVLLHAGERVGQIGERAQQICAAAGGNADSDQFRRAPDVLDALDGRGREVVGADEERIVVEDLSARGLVVGVIQADERVSEKGSKAAARGFELGGRTGIANDRGEVGPNLQFDVAGGVDDGRPARFFTSGEDGAGQLEFAQVAGKQDEVVGNVGSVGHLVEAVVEAEERVEGDQVLVNHDGADSAGEFLMGAAAVGAVLRGPASRSMS